MFKTVMAWPTASARPAALAALLVLALGMALAFPALGASVGGEAIPEASAAAAVPGPTAPPSAAAAVSGSAAPPSAPAVVSGSAAPPSATDAVPARPHRHPPAAHLTAAQRIDAHVRRLARGLDLDAGQQEKLRQILVDQHRQMLLLHGGNAAASGDVAGTTLAIYDQTKTRIRAILNDEQKKKYIVDVPREDLAPAQADLQHWMDLQEARRRQDSEVAK